MFSASGNSLCSRHFVGCLIQLRVHSSHLCLSCPHFSGKFKNKKLAITFLMFWQKLMEFSVMLAPTKWFPSSGSLPPPTIPRGRGRPSAKLSRTPHSHQVSKREAFWTWLQSLPSPHTYNPVSRLCQGFSLMGSPCRASGPSYHMGSSKTSCPRHQNILGYPCLQWFPHKDSH